MIRLGSTYLNRIERFGPPRDGVLALYGDRLRFAPDAGKPRWTSTRSRPCSRARAPSGEGAAPARRLLPLPGGIGPLLGGAAVCGDSPALPCEWRGEIIEFQPRIVTR